MDRSDFLFTLSLALAAARLLRIGPAKAPGGVETAAAIVASFALAWLSWRFVEQPFRTPGTRLYTSTPRAILRGLLVLSLFAGTGLAIREADGWWWRLDAPARQVYAEMESENSYRRSCDGVANIFVNDDECTFGRPKPPSRSFDIAVFGDSTADQFVPLVATQTERLGLSGRQITQSACAPVFGAWQVTLPQWRGDFCLKYQSEMLRLLTANPDLKLAVLATNWASYQRPAYVGHNGLAIPGDPTPPRRSREPHPLEPLLERTVRHILKQGAKVLLIGQIPYRAEFPLECAIAARRDGKTGSHCAVPGARIRKDLAVANAAIKAVAGRNPGVSAALPTGILCDRDHCYAVMDGVFLYANPGHLNAAGARYVSRFITLPVDTGE